MDYTKPLQWGCCMNENLFYALLAKMMAGNQENAEKLNGFLQDLPSQDLGGCNYHQYPQAQSGNRSHRICERVWESILRRNHSQRSKI